MDAEELDRAVRLAAFAFLADLESTHGDVLPRSLLARGFEFLGQRVPLVGPPGIFKPAILRMGVPLTITTAPTIEVATDRTTTK